jgi:hypothetical protein
LIDILSVVSAARKSADQPMQLRMSRCMRIAKLIRRLHLGQLGELDESANTLTPRKLHFRRTPRKEDSRYLALAEQRTRRGGVDQEQSEDPDLDGKKLVPLEVNCQVIRDAREPSAADPVFDDTLQESQ